MNLLENYPKVELYSTGEFRMGTASYGIVIRTKYGVFNFLKNVPTIIGSDDYSSNIEFSSCGRYMKVIGPDIEYVLDSKNMKVSVFRINVRAQRQDGQIVFSREHCVFGSHSEHIHGFKSTVFIQCPWVAQQSLIGFVDRYSIFRQTQLADAISQRV